MNNKISVDGGGLRYNTGKTRFDLVSPFAHEELAKVLTKGAEKYAPHNWQRGMDWTTVLASLERHVEAFKRGEDYDPETGLLHMGHVMCNAMFLTEYYKIYPQGDNRLLDYLKPLKIGVDVDDVIADTIQHIMDTKGWTDPPRSWNDPRFSPELFKELGKDKEFWLSIPPKKGEPLSFEPCCYVTSRHIPQEWTQEWLDKHSFPAAPLYSTAGGSKVEVLKDLDIDVFVDDNYYNFVDINNSGVFCYLLTCSHNIMYDVGHRRLDKLSDLK